MPARSGGLADRRPRPATSTSMPSSNASTSWPRAVRARTSMPSLRTCAGPWASGATPTTTAIRATHCSTSCSIGAAGSRSRCQSSCWRLADGSTYRSRAWACPGTSSCVTPRTTTCSSIRSTGCSSTGLAARHCSPSSTAPRPGSSPLPRAGRARATMARMLTNLQRSFVGRGDRAGALWSQCLRVLVPGTTVTDRRQLAAMLAANGRFDSAAQELDAIAEEGIGGLRPHRGHRDARQAQLTRRGAGKSVRSGLRRPRRHGLRGQFLQAVPQAVGGVIERRRIGIVVSS